MKHVVELPGSAIVNRAVHTMAVIVIILFAFHFARLSGFSASAVAIAALISLVAAASSGLRRVIAVDSGTRRITSTVAAFSLPLRTRHLDLPGMAWCAVRRDLPDLVVEAGNAAGETVEVFRFRNGYGSGESMADAACVRLAAALQVPVRKADEQRVSPHEHIKE